MKRRPPKDDLDEPLPPGVPVIDETAFLRNYNSQLVVILLKIAKISQQPREGTIGQLPEHIEKVMARLNSLVALVKRSKR